nr:PREDICTED: voltage-dependent calcium channel gamma-3 subunit [Struthio camelus australis]
MSEGEGGAVELGQCGQGPRAGGALPPRRVGSERCGRGRVSTSPSLALLPGLSNIIGIIVYISANAGDPGQSDSKKSYSYGWSFYFGALSFIIAEMVGVIAVHMYIEKHRQIRAKSHAELLKKSAFTRLPTYRYRFRRRSSSRSTEPRSRDMSPVSKGFNTIPSTDISMFTLSRDPSKITMGSLLNSERDHSFLQVHNSIPKEFKESLHNNPANRRTTPV